MTTEAMTRPEYSKYLEDRFAQSLVPRVKAFFDHDKEKAAAFVRACHVAVMNSEQNQALAECPIDTIINSCIEVADCGLSLNPSLRHAALIPYGGVCTLSVMYRGLVQMAVADGKNVLRIEAHVVREGDGFRYNRGTNPSIEHKPRLETADNAITAAYAIAYFNDGSFMYEVMSVEQMNTRHRAKSKAYQRGRGPWVNDEESMYRKCVVRILCKWLDLAPRTARYLKRDEDIERGVTIDVQHEVANKAPEEDLADAIVVPGAPVVDVEGAVFDKLADELVGDEDEEAYKAERAKLEADAANLRGNLMIATIAKLIRTPLAADTLSHYMDKTHGLMFDIIDAGDKFEHTLQTTFTGNVEALQDTYNWVVETYGKKDPEE